MPDGNFEAAIEEAKKLEKKLTEYAPYEGEITVQRTLDLEPRDYIDLSYQDMLNQYERVQKIISTTERGLFTAEAGEKAVEAPPPASKPSAATQEIETKILEMTTKSLKSAEEVGKEPIALERAPEAPTPEEAPVEPHKMEIEFEQRPAEKEIEIERPEKEKIEIETPASEQPKEVEPEEKPAEIEIEPEKKPAPRPERTPEVPAPEPVMELPPEEKKIIIAAVPPALKESPDDAAGKRYQKMEEHVRAMVGEQADEATLKKTMLDLTKQLFKEKSVNARNELKLQITVLKNMLSSVQTTKGSARKPRGIEEDAHLKLFDTMVATQQSELAQTKDNIIDSYNKQITTIKKKFYEDLQMTEDSARRKQIFDSFAFSVTSIIEQLPEVITKYRDFTAKKHKAEMEKLKGSLSTSEKTSRAAVDKRLEYINTKYAQEFSSVKGILGHQIDNLLEVSGADVFKKAATPEESEAKAYEIVKETNDTDEGTLLYFLHKKDPEFYKMYERKQISRAEAVFKAKELMASEKGLSTSMVRKYFTYTEG